MKQPQRLDPAPPLSACSPPADVRAWAGRLLLLAALVSTFISIGCAGTRAGSGLHRMPATAGQAIAPADANPASAGELAEGALHLLDVERPGGPDYLGAARMCLLAVEVADPQVERDLLRACYRVAARSGLRSGNREIYVEAVSRWAENAPRHEWSTGELAIHLAIRNRLSGQTEPRGRIPRSLRELLPAPGAGPVH